MKKRPWGNTFTAIIKKELIETFKSMKAIMLLCVATSNLLQYITIQEVIKLGLSSSECALQLGSITIYMAVIIILFMGHTLVNRFIYEERKSKTINVLLSAGMPKTAIWSAKMVVTILVCSLILTVSILCNVAFIYFYFGILVRYTALSAVLTFVTMPILCYGVLALISVAYWYFYNMNVFGMIFPIVAYLGIWNLSIKLAGYFVPNSLLLISFLIGFVLFFVSFSLVKLISKERMAGIDI